MDEQAFTSSVHCEDPKAALGWLADAFGFETTMAIDGPPEAPEMCHYEMSCGGRGRVMVGAEWAEWAPGESRYTDAAAAAAGAGGRLLGPNASMFGRALSVQALLTADAVEVAVVGAADAREPLLEVVRARYRPFCAVAAGDPGGDAGAVPLLAHRGSAGGDAAAYVCRGHVCDAPVTTPEALAAALG